jgi:ATP-dependent Clp protease adaptor protein ClpS
MSANSPGASSETITRQRTKLPSQWKVVVMNNDVTPFDFVIALLIKIFHHPEAIAKDLTTKIHKDGSAIVGIYPFEIAEQKSHVATKVAKDFGFPMVIKLEEEKQ